MENKDNVLSVHNDGDIEYYSIAALDDFCDIENYILPKTFDDKEDEDADFFRVCALFDFNFNKIITIRNFNYESTEINIFKDVDARTFTEVSNDVCAIITDIRKAPLIIRSNNILNAIIYDPVKKIIALAAVSMHQSLDKMLKNLVLELNIKYNSNPMDLKVAMISFCDRKADVNDDILDIFKHNFHNINHCISQTEEGINQVDLCKINIATLLEVGVKYENIINIKDNDLPRMLTTGDTVYTIINIK